MSITVPTYVLSEKPPKKYTPADLYRINNPNATDNFTKFKAENPAKAKLYQDKADSLVEQHEKDELLWSLKFPALAKEMELKEQEAKEKRAAARKKAPGGEESEPEESPKPKKTKMTEKDIKDPGLDVRDVAKNAKAGKKAPTTPKKVEAAAEDPRVVAMAKEIADLKAKCDKDISALTAKFEKLRKQVGV